MVFKKKIKLVICPYKREHYDNWIGNKIIFIENDILSLFPLKGNAKHATKENRLTKYTYK